MTSKCKTCGHFEHNHDRYDGSCREGTCYSNFKCCKKFQPEDDFFEGRDDDGDMFIGQRVKQKGCGNWSPDGNKKCGVHGLCPECKNQSPLRRKSHFRSGDAPEEDSSNLVQTSGIQSPHGVYIERAAKLDREGIKAVCGTEKEYSDYVKKQKKGNGRMTDPEYTEENKEHFEVSNDDLNWKPCLRCGGELTQKRKAFFECVNCAQGFIADEEDMKLK